MFDNCGFLNCMNDVICDSSADKRVKIKLNAEMYFLKYLFQ